MQQCSRKSGKSGAYKPALQKAITLAQRTNHAITARWFVTELGFTWSQAYNCIYWAVNDRKILRRVGFGQFMPINELVAA